MCVCVCVRACVRVCVRAFSYYEPKLAILEKVGGWKLLFGQRDAKVIK